jgi:hypothetical protein
VTSVAARHKVNLRDDVSAAEVYDTSVPAVSQKKMDFPNVEMLVDDTFLAAES